MNGELTAFKLYRTMLYIKRVSSEIQSTSGNCFHSMRDKKQQLNKKSFD